MHDIIRSYRKRLYDLFDFAKEKTMEKKETIIRTEKLSKSFSVGGKQHHIIKNLDLEIYKGDFTAIMGSSGAGK